MKRFNFYSSLAPLIYSTCSCSGTTDSARKLDPQADASARGDVKHVPGDVLATDHFGFARFGDEVPAGAQGVGLHRRPG